MNARTPKEIAGEIMALEELQKGFNVQTSRLIDVMIEELLYGQDRTAEEWNDLSPDEQAAADSAYEWKTGQSEKRPSEMVKL